MCWAEVAQELNDFVEAIFTDVCADAEHLPDHGVCDVVTQGDQREQHFLIRIELAPPAAGTALASGLGSLCGETPGSEFGQHCGKKQAEGGRLQAQQGMDTIFGKRLKLLKVHAKIFGSSQYNLYYTEYLLVSTGFESLFVMNFRTWSVWASVSSQIKQV